jgi:hypothetical protein
VIAAAAGATSLFCAGGVSSEALESSEIEVGISRENRRNEPRK